MSCWALAPVYWLRHSRQPGLAPDGSTKPSNKVLSELRSRIVLGRWHITLVGDYKRAFAILLTSGPCCHQLSIQLASGVQPNGPCVRPRQSTTGVNVPEPAATPSSAFAAVAAHNQKVSATPQRDGRKPNILVIMGDASAGSIRVVTTMA